jgi:hypothetical protein
MVRNHIPQVIAGILPYLIGRNADLLILKRDDAIADYGKIEDVGIQFLERYVLDDEMLQIKHKDVHDHIVEDVDVIETISDEL